MSQEWSPKEHALRQAERAFHEALAEVRRLATRELEPPEFFSELLQHVSGPLQAVAAAVWLQSAEGSLELESQLSLSEIDGVASPEGAARHLRLLEQVRDSDGGLLAPPRYSPDGPTGAGNPTDYALVVAPLRKHRRVAGVIETFQPPARPEQLRPAELRPEQLRPEELQRGHLWFLDQVCAVVQDYLMDWTLRESEQNQASWSQFERFGQLAHRSLNRRETAYTIANEARRLIGCDRVTVALYRGGKCRTEAISGQDVFDHRSNVVRQLNQLTSRVVKSGEPLWYTGDRADLAPQIEEVLDGFLDESHSRLVAVLPLIQPRAEEDEKRTARPADVPVGALLIEQFRDTQLPPGFRRRTEVVQQISAQALANAVEHEGLFLAPLLRGVGKLKVLRHRPWAKITAAAVVAVVLALVFVPADFELEGRGTLEPVGRHDVFTAIDGVVDEVLIEHGEPVKAGEQLLQLRNVDVEVKLADLTGQSQATAKRLRAVNTTLLGNRVSPTERARLHGERAQLIDTLASLRSQLTWYRRKTEQLEVRAPVGGKVVTWDVRNLLIHRPVERGQMLVSLAAVDGEWELEIRMPEDRMGHIGRARGQDGKKLPVTFILATEPGVSYEGTLERVHQRAEVRGEEGNTVLLKVAIDKRDLSQLRRGATVVARVHCGRRPLGYVWFHDLWEFVQSRVLFRL